MEYLATVMAAGQIGAGIAVLTGSFTAVGQGNTAAATIEAIARQPESKGAINSSMFIGMAMCETGGIYGLLIAIILLFANPLVNRFIALMG